MGKSLAVVRRCRKYLTANTAKIVLNSIVLSYLDYCQIVWARATQKDLNKLQLVQNKAARLALQCPYNNGINNMQSCLQWLKVEDRVNAALLFSIWKTLQFKTPLYQYNQLKHNHDSYTYATRQATQVRFMLPKPKPNFLKHTIEYRSIKVWNSLPLPITKLTNTLTFKKQIKKYLGISYL